ncbi:malectin domain-containing carbohydrate-binding protein [Dyadobacter bucti]|uniref:malectin domain-containing carbohydrate-binding protein n=1 Tax=Dyadobacter bucti TaxID=2572203 RepID=UPI001109A952|nr:malectin domain-containing carbohydrate-binding protein [Dyadobacter bucti]
MKKDLYAVQNLRHFQKIWQLIFLAGLLCNVHAYASGPVTETGSVSRSASKSAERKASAFRLPAAPAFAACSLITTLQCEEINPALPFSLDFNGTEGGLTDAAGNGTGFRMVDIYSSATRAAGDGSPSSALIGYEPSRLAVANGVLTIDAHKGIAYQGNNNQINALGIGVENSGTLIFETTVLNPMNGSNAEQAGLWVGLGDKTFLKLAAAGNKVEMRRELNDVSSTALNGQLTSQHQRITESVPGLNTSSVRLRLIVDLTANTVDGFYSLDGANYINIGARYPATSLNISDMGFAGQALYGGIFATKRNSDAASVQFRFDNFSVSRPAVPQPNEAPVFANTSYTFTHPENLAVNAEIGTISASDAADQTITYALTGGDGKFAIHAGTGVITLLSALDFDTAASHTFTVTATDNASPAASASTEVTINVTEVIAEPVNAAPVVDAGIPAQTASTNSPFTLSVPANAFKDDDNDVLTLTATLTDDSALPGWLAFSNGTFSGTPSTAADYNIKVNATDGKASVSTNFILNVTSPVTGCPPNSTLPCDQLAVTLPFSLTFNGTEGGLADKNNAGTGFTLADAYSGSRHAADGAVPAHGLKGYDASRLTIGGDRLTILANNGLAFTGSNNQINALAVAVPSAGGKLTFETTIINPFNGSNAEQGGLWVGLNDKTYIKLAATVNKVEMRRELNDASTSSTSLSNPHQRITETVSNLNSSTVRLRLVLDLVHNKMEGFYSLDGVNYVNVGSRYNTEAQPSAIDVSDMGFNGQTLLAGIFGSKRNNDSNTDLEYVFDDFSIKKTDFPVVSAPYRINAGGVTRTVNGAVFNADDQYAVLQGDLPTGSFALVGNHPVPELYYERRAGYNLAYAIPIANGAYTVKLHMVENMHTSLNSRIFDVKMENVTVLDDIDLFAQGGNQGKVVVVKSFDANVTDGVLNIDFIAAKDKAIINAIEILPVSAVNDAPVIVTAPENQNVFAGQQFSFITGSFSDPNAGDVLTYSATRADGSALPSWISFDPATQAFSGNAPAEPTTVSLKIIATDQLLAAASADFSLTVEAMPTDIPCSPLSTLPCDQIAVNLPFLLNFDGTEGGLVDKSGVQTGFTMADPYTGSRQAADGTPSSAIIGYEPSQLTVADGRLSIVTNKGIAYSNTGQPNNNQINSLGVSIIADGKLTVETTLITPFNGTSSQQAGLWLGLNDKTYVKLVVVGNKLEMRRELNDVSSNTSGIVNTDQRITDAVAGLDTRTVRLRMVVDLTNGKLEGFYSVDGVTYVNVGARYTSAANPAAIDITNLELAGKTVYTGIFATHRNASTPETFTFENFSVTSNAAAAKTLTFTPNALDFTATQGQQVTAQTATLAASEGTPAITFSNTSASWFTIPDATLGAVTFGPANFSTTMAPGIYETVVTASAQGYEPATLLINLTVSAPGVAEVTQINFQDPGTVPPTGWIRDYGQAYGARTGANQGNGLEYGWKRPSDGAPLDLSVGGNIPGNGRKRTTPADITQATFMHMQADDLPGNFNGVKAEGYWEMKVVNGIYDVTVSAGDPDPQSAAESHTINVEGVNAFSNFVPTGSAGSATRFKSATVRAIVTDGFMTINANGGTNTKINSAIITPIDLGPYLLWSASEHSLVIDAGTNETIKTTSLDLFHSTTTAGLPITLSATYGQGASNWLSFSPTHNGDEPNVTFDYIAAKSLAVGTYTATVTASAANHTSASTLIQITVMAPGTNQPYVMSSTPLDGATNVSVNITPISANDLFVPAVPGFQGGVDNATITTANVKLFKVVGEQLIEVEALGVNGTGGHDAISFKPKFSLELSTKYKFIVTSGVKSHTGAAFLPYEATFTTSSTVTGAPNPVAAEFAPKVVIPGTIGKKYTCLTFGPDGKLYALRLDGTIERFTVDHTTGMLSEQTEIKTLTAKYGLRSSVGLTFAPESTPTNLIAYISHCSAGLTNAPEFDGNISRLTGADLESEQLILTKLPRSKADHLVNSITFGPDGALYFNQGSNSSMGALDTGWQREETLLSASLMRLDLTKLAGVTLPLDVRTTANQALINAAPVDNIRMSDGTYNPYAANSPLTIYASGIRNAVDMVWHTNGQLYVPTNGSAAGGNSPASVPGTRRPDGTFYSGPPVIGTSSVKLQRDWLFRVNPLKPTGYFGHPNPLRGEYVANRGYLDNPLYPETQGPDANYRGAAYDFEENKSPNGVIEYKSNAFNGALKGRILVCRFSGGSDIIVMEPGSMAPDPAVNSPLADDHVYDIIGAQTGAGTDGITGLSGFANPLDLTEDVETGNLYVIEYNWNNQNGKTAQIVLLKAAALSEQKGIATVTPASIIENDVTGGAAGPGRPVTVANTGNAPLKVTGITIEGVDQSQFQLVGAPAPSVASPVTIARSSAITFNVVFNPTSTGVKKATILITSENNPVQQVTLSGLGTTGLSGNNEPSLQLVLDVHGINVNVGDDNKNTNIIHSSNFNAALLGEEVPVQAFQRASDGPVEIAPISVFGPQDAGGIVTGFGWYSSGQPTAKNELFTVGNNSYQTVNVQVNGSLTFDPGTDSFGFYSRWPYFANRHVYSEDALNNFANAIPHHVRVYELKDAAGNIVENSYVVAMEEHISGFDYQDMVVLVTNVKPFGAPVEKTLAFSAPSLSFQHLFGSPVPATQNVTLTSSFGSPALTLSKSPVAEWLTLPNAALGTIALGIDPTGLTPGTYESTLTLAANGYTSANMLVTLTVTAPASSARIVASDAELVFDATKNTTRTRRITVTNTGTTALNLGTLAISGTSAANFSVTQVIPEGETASSTLAPEQTQSYDVTFAPGNTVNTFDAALVINSNAVNAPALTVGLYAMSVNGYEGSNEPPLQKVVNTLGYNINVGWTALVGGIQPTMKGEEVPVQFFEKAGDGPVIIKPVARYSPNQELPFGYYTKTDNAPALTNVGTLSGVFGQHNILYPQIVAGTNQFNPAGPFGIFVIGLENRLSYTEDPLNAGGPALHAARVYPMKDRQGVLIPNSYLVCFEDASNGDYQDYVFVLENVIAAGTRKALAFTQKTMDFAAPLNGTADNKTLTLEAKNGTPGPVTFTRTAPATWLTTPNPALGILSFGVNTSGLPAGLYTTVVKATAADFAMDSVVVNLRVTDVSANATMVNFQLSTTATPAGYIADIGMAYDDTRGFGWVNPTTKAPKDHTGSMRERNVTSAETRLRTFALMQGNSPQTPGSWEMKVPNGQYNVTVAAGDIGFYDSNHRINVEGVTAITNFIPTAQMSNRIATVTVAVTDGKLTVDATGGTNTKINFVIVDPATAEGDFISPVASLALSGTLQSAGVYRNQVIAALTASDMGGSNLSKVQYSLNNAAYQDYYSPILINTPGTYILRGRAIDGNNNTTTTDPVSFSVVQPAASNASMLVENLDKFPGNDQLTFSLIQVPWRRTNEDGTFTPYNRNHDVVKLKVSNKGAGALNISNLNFTNTAGWKIATVNNVTYDPATAAPIVVNPAGSVEIGIQFIANFPTGRVRVLNDTLHILSNDDLTPKKSIVLRGLWQSAGEGNSEPRAQEIISAFGFKSNVGFTSSDGTNAGSSLILNTDEIISAFFTRADASKPVSVVQMAGYHGCCAATETFQYYTKGSTSTTSLFTHHPLDGQSLLPLRNGTSGLLAEGSFNHTGNFGFRIASSYSDRTRNSEGKIGMRFWKAMDANGNIIPNAYIIGHDYIGNPAVTNYDYQDNVYYVTNIKPETGSTNYSELAALTSAVDFGSQVISMNHAVTVDLKNLGQTYANGTSDPSLTIKSVAITGPNQNEFFTEMPSKTVLNPQDTSHLSVSFHPNTAGIKNAFLTVTYNSNLSPLRIPLYGIGDDNCSMISVLKRIKGGADANVTINGKVWESDKNYRQGSVQLDKPAATPIAGTDDDVLYQTYLSATTDLAETRYVVPLANGNYMVRMHFVENFFTTTGSRVFSINLEDQNRLSNLDIHREAGYKAALVKDFSVSVADGKLDVKFNPTVNRVALAGMEIFSASANPNAVTLVQQSVNSATCGMANGSITFTATNSAATSFLYKLGPNGNYQASPTFANLAAGNYTFFVKENTANGCETSKVFTIAEQNNLAFDVSAPVLSCNATFGTATVGNITGGSGNYTISWATSPAQTGATATNLLPGVYEVTVTDAVGGCNRTIQVSVDRAQNCGTLVRINSAGPSFLATGSRQFGADQYFGGTDGTSSITGVDILNTTDDALYMTERSSAAFNYAIPVENGTMNVILHFAEIWFGAPGKGAGGIGKRMFNVDMEGSRKLTNYDIYAKAGGAIRAIQETFSVTVTDGVLNINFLSGAANKPKISAIEVVPASGVPVTLTLTPQADAHVRNGSYSAINYGNEQAMLVKTGSGDGITRSSYLKFSLGNVSDVTSAKLRIYGSNLENSTGINLSAYGVDNDSWTETGINFNNAPSASATALSSVSVNNVAKYYELDVTSYVQAQAAGDKVVSLQIRNATSQNKNLSFNTKENAANQPQLIVQGTSSGAPSGGRVSQEFFEPVREVAEEITYEKSRIYPNPAQKRFTVEVSGQHAGNISLQMISDAGRTYPVRLTEALKGGSKAEVDITNLSLRSGVYLLRVQSASTSEIIRVLIID